MPIPVPIDREKIADFCQRWKILEFALFGSVLRDDFGAESDIDVLVSFEDKHGWTLLDLARMEFELQDLLGRKVDLWTRKGIEQSRNPYRRRDILTSAQVIHAA